VPGALPLTSASLVVRNDNLIDAEIDNEVVALKIESGACYGLNRVGSRIWALMAAPRRVSDICATLQKEYEIESRACERQVLDLLEELLAEDLITTPKEFTTPK
jgi:hypothetical protein